MTDGTQGHGLNELNEHLKEIRWTTGIIPVHAYPYLFVEKLLVINWNVLVRPEHDTNGTEEEVECAQLAKIEIIFTES